MPQGNLGDKMTNLTRNQNDDILYESDQDLGQTSGAKPAVTARERADVAHYVAHMSAELAQMAAAAKLETVSYLLSMVQLEADVESRRG